MVNKSRENKTVCFSPNRWSIFQKKMFAQEYDCFAAMQMYSDCFGMLAEGQPNEYYATYQYTYPGVR
jgi:hypothetical protein